MAPCDTNGNYLASPGFLTLALHTMSCFAAPIHTFGFYCILRKTPNQMLSVKWIMFNLHLWGVVLDFFITFLAVPYTVFPAMAGYGMGFVDSPGFFIYIIVTVINAVSTSVFAVFENRWFVLYGENTWWKHFRKPIIAFSYMMTPLYFLPPHFYIPDQEVAREAVWKSLSCQPELPPDRKLFVLSLDQRLPAYTVLLCELIPSIEISSFFILIVRNLWFGRNSQTLSQRTARMQRKLVFALIVQSIAILILFSVPINVVALIIKFWYQNQVLNNLVFVSLSVHGICTTLIMIFVHKPYRDFALSPLSRLYRKVPTVLVRTSETSSQRNIIRRSRH